MGVSKCLTLAPFWVPKRYQKTTFSIVLAGLMKNTISMAGKSGPHLSNAIKFLDPKSWTDWTHYDQTIWSNKRFVNEHIHR